MLNNVFRDGLWSFSYVQFIKTSPLGVWGSWKREEEKGGGRERSGENI